MNQHRTRHYALLVRRNDGPNEWRFYRARSPAVAILTAENKMDVVEVLRAQEITAEQFAAAAGRLTGKR
jgi:hypothetical protein